MLQSQMKQNKLFDKNILAILIVSILLIGCNSNEDEIAKKITLTKEQQEVADKKYVSKNIAICQGCHGSGFGRKALGKSLVVRDMTKSHITQALIGYKNNTYGRESKELMKRHVDRYTNSQLEQIANIIINKI